MTGRKRYTGVLQEPMDSHLDGVSQLKERVEALCTHYGLPPQSHTSHFGLWLLFYSLARDRVPGFKSKRTKYGPAPWRVETDVAIGFEIGELTKQGHSVRNAARLAAKRNPGWNLEPSSVLRRYNNLLKNTPQALRAMVSLDRLLVDCLRIGGNDIPEELRHGIEELRLFPLK